ncbi:MAG: hypothetical protein GX885_11470 [Methanomicrobiales archaeon]|nr:hypothetical protein [Methanomicrobiales archaeon]
MTLPEKLRFILRYGRLTKVDGEWKFTRHPDAACPVIEMVNGSKWAIVERVYEMIIELK